MPKRKEQDTKLVAEANRFIEKNGGVKKTKRKAAQKAKDLNHKVFESAVPAKPKKAGTKKAAKPKAEGSPKKEASPKKGRGKGKKAEEKKEENKEEEKKEEKKEDAKN